MTRQVVGHDDDWRWAGLLEVWLVDQSMCSDIKDQSGSSESVANPSEVSISVCLFKCFAGGETSVSRYANGNHRAPEEKTASSPTHLEPVRFFLAETAPANVSVLARRQENKALLSSSSWAWGGGAQLEPAFSPRLSSSHKADKIQIPPC